MPKVSVLMSIYRPDYHYLVEQLQTIDDQDFEDMEVVVYDDSPDDPSFEDLCRECCSRHSLRYIKGERNLGYVKAFEYLVSLAEGEYLALSDQDDRWLPDRIACGVHMLDKGYLLVCCDRQVIDDKGRVVVRSWRAAHPLDDSVAWHSGDPITRRAAFACYSLGMATMVRADVARRLIPFPVCTGHDKWLALGASALGPCANIEGPLVQYRQHARNQTGILQGIMSKADWYRTRTKSSYDLVCEFVRRFPSSSDTADMLGFAEARLKRDIRGIWRYRYLAPQVAKFEIVLHLMPEWMCKVFCACYATRRGGKP